MKRLLSLILCAIMLCTVILPIKSVEETEKTTLYSGGSGTEDDPYLISTAADIEAIYNYCIENPDLRMPKVYYKLTKDITLYYEQKVFSPLYISDYLGANALEKAPYTLSDFSGEDAEKRFNEALEKYGELYIIKTSGGWFSHTTYFESLPFTVDLQSNVVRINSFDDINTFNDHNLTVIKELDEICNTYYGTNIWGGNYELYSQDLYYQIGFAGVLDGNGHTIKLTNTNTHSFLFGYLKNGAVIKNLNLTGDRLPMANDDGIGFAYEIGEGCTISNCTINTTAKYFYYFSYAKEVVPSLGRDYHLNGEWSFPAYRVEEGCCAIVNNYGTVQNCWNLASFVFDQDQKDIVKKLNTLKQYVIGLFGSNKTAPKSNDINMDGAINAKDIWVAEMIVAGLDPRE